MPATRRQIRAELLRLKDDKGLIHAEPVVEWAQRHPKSGLHSRFQWDDSIAAHEHRLWQARQLISMHIIVASGTHEFISLTVDRANGGGYRETTTVVATRSLREVMMDDALQELERLKRKYQLLEELAQVWRAADAVRPRRKRAAAARITPPRQRRMPPGGAEHAPAPA
jgi:hypothetical protein